MKKLATKWDELIDALYESEDDAWGPLRSELEEITHLLADSSTISSDEREDVIQATCLQLLNPAELNRLRTANSPGSYVRRILYSRIRDVHRQKRRTRRAERRFSETTPRDANGDPQAILIREELQDRVQRSLRRLPTADQRILKWFYEKGLTYKQVAERLHIAPSAALKRVERARRRFREIYSD